MERKLMAVIDVAYIARQALWSGETFGPGERTKGIADHIKKELVEVENDPTGTEYCDIVILALDGAWRKGMEPEDILAYMLEKQEVNFARKWPDWKLFSEDQAIEHIRDVGNN